VRSEQAQAESAADFLENWAGGASADATAHPLRTADTARLLGVTLDALRTWERNGLVEVPANPRTATASMDRLRSGGCGWCACCAAPAILWQPSCACSPDR
jgi:hypothetical protein